MAAKTPKERELERKQERQEHMEGQIASGSLKVRKMTEADKRSYAKSVATRRT